MKLSKTLWKGMRAHFIRHSWKLGAACTGVVAWIALRPNLPELAAGVLAFLLLVSVMYQAYVLAVMGGLLFNLPAEVRRKTAHLLGGGMLLLAALLTGMTAVVVAMCVLLLAWLLATRNLSSLKMYRQLSVDRRDGSVSWGDLWFPLGMGATALWFGASSPEWLAAALVLTVADSAAALVGTRMRRFFYRIGKNRKSLGGSLACLLAAVASIGAVGLIADVSWSWTACLGLAGVLTAAEAVCTRGLDNFLLPLMTAAGLAALEQFASSTWLLAGAIGLASLVVLALYQGLAEKEASSVPGTSRIGLQDIK